METITIPQYPTRIQLTNSRRPQYYTDVKNIPKKYQNLRYVFKAGKLYDIKRKKFVARNEASRQKPRYVTISGNNLYSRMHERVRIKIMHELKSTMRPYLPDKLDLKFPVKVTMRVYRTVDTGNWDLDNFNIFYFKAFFDLLRDEKLIPDDSIQYIVAVGSELIPITDDAERRLEFIFETSQRSEITEHLLYQDTPVELQKGKSKWSIQLVKELETGKVLIDYDAHIYRINIGKRYIVWNALNKVLTSIAVHALIINEPVTVTHEFASMCETALKDIMFSHHIPVYIDGHDTDKWIKQLFEKTDKNGKIES